MSYRSIDPVLSKLAPFFSGSADDLIDIREAALKAENAGKCVRCYFSIYGRTRAAEADRLHPLKKWIEHHLEIVALDESGNELERIPFLLHGDDLESFCREIMAEFHENRVYQQKEIRLKFGFRQADRAA
ncbi:MAG TPA: hypothetical protein PLA50_14460 [Bacteroidia bacterium]|nr:hypothetical protein [Bacteroidia bacterium]